MTRKTNPTQPRVRLLLTSLLPLLLLSVWCLHDSHAYVRTKNSSGNYVFWSNPRVTINLNLGYSFWNEAAKGALTEWNKTGARFKFDIGSKRVGASCGRPDHINTVVWASTICGKRFDKNALAVESGYARPDGTLADSDVRFYTAHKWDVYSGPWRSDVSDLRRVALHEFGHVLGLNHPDEHGQSVRAIMNSKADDLERLQTDDINGIRAIYSGSGGGGGRGRVGHAD